VGDSLQSNQYAVKVFETTISDEKKFIEFFDVNYTLFKDHLILIEGDLSDKIKSYLEEKELKYLNNVDLPKGRTRKALEKEFLAQKAESVISRQIAEAEVLKLSDKLQNNLTVMDEMIRSGREIKIDGDLLLMNRVNSGATIKTTGNLIITQVVEGSVRCQGNFMMLTASPKANIVFQNVEVDNTLLEDRLNRVELKNNEIIITPVLKKEINWA
jgi:septum site-determining protein MinC